MRYELCILALITSRLPTTERSQNICDVTFSPFSVCVCMCVCSNVAIEDLNYDRSQLIANVFEFKSSHNHIHSTHSQRARAKKNKIKKKWRSAHTVEGASFTQIHALNEDERKRKYEKSQFSYSWHDTHVFYAPILPFGRSHTGNLAGIFLRVRACLRAYSIAHGAHTLHTVNQCVSALPISVFFFVLFYLFISFFHKFSDSICYGIIFSCRCCRCCCCCWWITCDRRIAYMLGVTKIYCEQKSCKFFTRKSRFSFSRFRCEVRAFALSLLLLLVLSVWFYPGSKFMTSIFEHFFFFFFLFLYFPLHRHSGVCCNTFDEWYLVRSFSCDTHG